MKRCLVFGFLLSLLAAGVLRIQLVAREAAEDDPGEISVEFSRQAELLANKIHGDSKLLKQFRDALQTPAGQIVLQDRASFFAERLREDAQSDAIPSYLDQHFTKAGDKYQLRDDQQAFRKQFISKVETFNADVKKIQTVLKSLGSRITGTSETDRLVARFLQHEAAPTMLYVEELRDRLRPDASLVERELGNIFVKNEQGKFIVRPGRRAEAERFLRQGKRILRGFKAIQVELQTLAGEFSERDDFNKTVKKRLAEPMFAAFIAAQLLNDEDVDVQRRIDGFFDEFGGIAVDTADGLAIIEEDAREEVRDSLDQFARAQSAAPKLAGPLKDFAANIDASEELERGWQQLLNTDIAALKLAEEFEVGDVDPAEAARDLLAEVIHESDDGTLTVREDNTEEITEFIREMFRMYRTVRRKGRAIDEVAAKLSDPELSKAFASLGGKFVVLHSIQQSFAGRDFEGLSTWVDEIFEPVDDGLVLRDGGEEELEGFLADVHNVEEELKKDDF